MLEFSPGATERMSLREIIIWPDPRLKEKCKAVGVECILSYPGHTDSHYKNSAAFLIERLKK